MVAGFLVALGFTQTQVGREALKNSLEYWFAESFDGTLSIGAVRGSLLWDLYLQDVQLHDASDSLMVDAQTITLRPRWVDLPGRDFNVRELMFTNVNLFARYQADGTWNLSSVRPRERRASGSRPWEFESTRILISGGRIISTHEADAPDFAVNQSNLDVTDLTVEAIDLEAQLRLRADERFLQIRNMSAALPEKGVIFDTIEAELVLHTNHWHINTLRLESGPSKIDLTGMEDIDSQAINLFVRESVFTPSFVKTWLPGLSVPDTVSVTGTIGFAPPRVDFADLHVRTAGSYVIASGMVENESFDINVTDGVVDSTYLRELFPSARMLPAIDSLSIEAAGTMAGPRPSGQGSFVIYSGSGAFSGSVQAEQDSIWTYTASVLTDNLDPALLNSELAGSLSGSATIAGFGLKSPNISASARLYSSVVNGLSLDSLQMEAEFGSQYVEASGSVFVSGGRLDLETDVSWADDQPIYELNGRSHELDLGIIWPQTPLETALNSAWTLSGKGLDFYNVSGLLDVRLDSSHASWNTSRRAIPPHQWTVNLRRPQSNEIRLTIGGDVMALEATGTIEQAAANAVGDLWLTAIRESVERQEGKRRSSVDAIAPAIRSFADQSLASQTAQSALNRASLSQVSLDADWQIKAGELLPFVPEINSRQAGSLFIQGDAQSLEIGLDLGRMDLNTRSLSAHDLELSLHAIAQSDAPLEESLNLTGFAQAARISGFGPELADVDAELKLSGGTGRARLAVAEADGPSSGVVNADIKVLGDRNRLSVGSALVNIGGELWQLLDTAHVDVFADAAIFTPLVMESDESGSGGPQRMQISGALSSEPADTFKVNLNNLILERLSETLSIVRRPIGGNLDARLQWTGLRRPEVTGTVSVDTLSLNHRLVGTFLAESRLMPERDDLQIRTIIRPTGKTPADLVHAENDLTVDGRVILPGTDESGRLDLAVDVTRLDAGFLEELIPVLGGVTGGIAGKGTVTGPFNSPDLDIAMAWPEGTLSIPNHNTSYAASASFRLLREGVRITGLELQDSGGGAAQLSGWLHFNDYRYLSFDVAGRLDAVQIMNVPTFSRDLAFYGDLSVSGDATLTGPVDGALLKSDNLVTTPQSELLIPIRELDQEIDPGFIIYADSSRSIAEQILAVREREHLLERRPEGERDFGTGLDMDLNIFGPPGSSIRLVIDPLLGDVINGIGAARIQLQRQEGQMLMYGSFDLTGGDYLFTAGEVFVRRFLISDGEIIWDGDPTNPSLNIEASYRTRASRSGLPDDVGGRLNSSLPLIVELHITGTLNAVQIGLNLAIDQRREAISDTPLLEGYLNQPDRAAEHATSVLLTNSFLLSAQGGSTNVLAGSAFNSVSSLVANQLNRYLGQVIPNADFTLGVQSDETAADLDVSAGIALRLLDERLVIRGLGVYRSLNAPEETAQTQGLEGEFVVELRLRPDVAVEVFYRRESDALSETLMTSETGLGVNYRAEFTSWRRLWHRIFKRERRTATAENTKRAQPQ